MLGNGTIIFNYLALTDPATIWNAKSEAGIVIGVSNGDGTWPAGSQNLNASDFGIDLIGYQIWCKNDDPLDPSTCMQAVLGRNGDFDLHDKSVVFNPDGTSGFLVSSTIKSGAGAGGSGVCAVLGDPAGGGAVAGASGGGGGGGISVTALLFMMFLPFVLPPRRSDRKTA
ncbi:MAG: hypothetical protein OEN02_17730 [Gammaproteobacteria bacterium]|nr:hypothetical protein [Gammaproteobacteria bacterium]